MKKDIVTVTTSDRDGHKIVLHTKPLSSSKQLQAHKAVRLEQEHTGRKRVTNYWSRRRGIMNMPVACWIMIVIITCMLIVGAILSR